MSTSVIGSAATTIHSGARLGVRERAHLFAEGARVREEHRRVEAEDRASGQPLRHRVAADVVIARDPGTRPRIGLVRPPRPAEHVADRERHRDSDAGQHAEQHDAEEGGHRQQELGPPQPVEPHGPLDVGQRQRRGDHHRGQRRLRQVAQQPGGQQQDQRDRGRAHQPGDLGLRAGLLGHRRAGAARADREPLEQARPRSSRPRCRSSPGCRRRSARCVPRTRATSRWCRPARRPRWPTRPPTAAGCRTGRSAGT